MIVLISSSLVYMPAQSMFDHYRGGKRLVGDMERAIWMSENTYFTNRNPKELHVIHQVFSCLLTTFLSLEPIFTLVDN